MNPPPRTLLEILQGLIERTYDLDTGIRTIGEFVVGEEGFRRVTRGCRLVHRVETRDGNPGPAVLVCQEGESVQAVLYYPGWLIRRLEIHSPLVRLSDRNLLPFFWFVEELDHLLFLADRVRHRRPVSLLELEFHANVTKDLAARLFLARQNPAGRLREEDRRWLRYHLYFRSDFSESEPLVRARYADAARFAYRYLRGLESLPAEARLRELRRYHRRTWPDQLQRIRRTGES